MKLEDLAEAIGDEIGLDQATAEALVLEAVDELVAGDGLVTVFGAAQVAVLDADDRVQARIREAVLELAEGGE